MSRELALQQLQAKLAEAVDIVAAKMAKGEMTEAEGRAFVRDVQAQGAKAILGVEETTEPVPAGADPRRAAPIDKPALTLYAESLIREGMTDKQVLDLVTDAAALPGTAIQERVEQERAVQQADADAVATANHEASPAGLAEFARAKRATDAVFESKLADGKTVLEAKGFSADDVAMLRDDEILRYSGVDPEAPLPDRGSHMHSNMIEGS